MTAASWFFFGSLVTLVIALAFVAAFYYESKR